jgi:hypothetical protein
MRLSPSRRMAPLHETEDLLDAATEPTESCSNKNSGGLTGHAKGQRQKGPTLRMAVNLEHTGSSLEAIRQN